mmetsp:Transcript_16648/g.51143  ORF Transcript_16648/g.51143 Transcript_16648/m.51143 type:complete len:297 (+) Transcript_16648:1156-2046(+)
MHHVGQPLQVRQAHAAGGALAPPAEMAPDLLYGAAALHEPRERPNAPGEALERRVHLTRGVHLVGFGQQILRLRLNQQAQPSAGKTSAAAPKTAALGLGRPRSCCGWPRGTRPPSPTTSTTPVLTEPTKSPKRRSAGTFCRNSGWQRPQPPPSELGPPASAPHLVASAASPSTPPRLRAPRPPRLGPRGPAKFCRGPISAAGQVVKFPLPPPNNQPQLLRRGRCWHPHAAGALPGAYAPRPGGANSAAARSVRSQNIPSCLIKPPRPRRPAQGDDSHPRRRCGSGSGSSSSWPTAI